MERAGAFQRLAVVLLAVLPLAGACFAVVRLWSHGVGWLDLLLSLGWYLASGFGVTIGFHRLLTHRSFRARRWLKVSLTIAGSMAFEGSAISWVAQHRRHHVHSDRPGDPHSPLTYARPGVIGRARGLWYAHLGWLLRKNRVDAQRWCPDLLADPDIVLVSALTPLWAAASLVLPFGMGWAFSGSLFGGFLALVWAGLVRVLVLHHVTWSINSICHAFGRRPFRTPDESRNVPVLALLSLGESWHNAHHAFPALARHGVDAGQVDLSAALIALFERLHWASEVRWPTRELLVRRRNADAGGPMS